MLLKNFSLKNMIAFFKGIDQIECDGTIRVMIPYLDQIDTVPILEERLTIKSQVPERRKSNKIS